MRFQRAALLSLPFVLLTALDAAAGGPEIQPNEYYVSVSREALEKDIRTCSTMARSTGAPTRAEVGTSVGGFSTGTSSNDDSDPIYRNAVERCLRNKGYNVVGWE